jgi:hypothetical protein
MDIQVCSFTTSYQHFCSGQSRMTFMSTGMVCSLIESGLVTTGSRITTRLVIVIATRLVVVVAAIVVVVIRLVFGRRLLHSAPFVGGRLLWLRLCGRLLSGLLGTGCGADTRGNSLVKCIVIVIGGLLEEEVGCQFLVLVAGEVGLRGAVLVESKSLKVLDGLHLLWRHLNLTGSGLTGTGLLLAGHATSASGLSSGHSSARVTSKNKVHEGLWVCLNSRKKSRLLSLQHCHEFLVKGRVLHYSGPQLCEVRVLCHLQNSCEVLVAFGYVFTAVVVSLGFHFATGGLDRVLGHLLGDAVGEVLEGAVWVAERGCECLRADVAALAGDGHQGAERLLVDLDGGGLRLGRGYGLLGLGNGLLDGGDGLLDRSGDRLRGSGGRLSGLGDLSLEGRGFGLSYNFLQRIDVNKYTRLLTFLIITTMKSPSLIEYSNKVLAWSDSTLP